MKNKILINSRENENDKTIFIYECFLKSNTYRTKKLKFKINNYIKRTSKNIKNNSLAKCSDKQMN